ncbi:Ferredoxin--NADP reductase [Planctomycetes bacterium Poly30]|uniref:Ferredoxin--NADP reductase n=2 Tax=Saltatorellus ferox TaxID=2528018 RepID=A0A518EME1_9BACT|nr:Ferredoxin--NADP reductase [Planctomycetes bacterium Poly30]
MCVLLVVLAASWARRLERSRMVKTVEEREEARQRGSHEARLQHPHIDLTRCMGCGLCVAACPEQGVLDVLHGQARVVHGSRCVGHSRCADECPVDAIAVTLSGVEERTDLPAIEVDFEAIGSPGLFLAGEVTGFALVRTAIAQGMAVAREVARRREETGRAAEARPAAEDMLDLLIVGAGPAGIACSLAALESGLRHVVIEQDQFGGTVAHYPRQKLVMTQPVELPLHGKLTQTTYTKEELIDLWHEIATQHALPVVTGERLDGIERREDGAFLVRTSEGFRVTRHVCLALGRRGSPRKLDVPGEDLTKVTYSLLDARAFEGRHVLVVGGGDSAIEAALGLGAQKDTTVTLSYRRTSFFRIKAKNEARILEAFHNGSVRAELGSNVRRIGDDRVELETDQGVIEIPNDHVFVLAGGIPPFKMLEECGVSFDPAMRLPVEEPTERGSGLIKALFVAFLLAMVTLAWSLLHGDYYDAPAHLRSSIDGHELLRPARNVGLACGIAAALAVVLNLLYLLRRGKRAWIRFGSLRGWMSLHVATGVSGFLLAVVHGGFLVRDTAGGHAILAMGVLIATGAMGRYLYSFVPRAANGRELALEEIQSRLAGLEGEWDADHPEYRHRVRGEVARLVAEGHWSRSLWRRVLATLTAQRRLKHTLHGLRLEGEGMGVPLERINDVLGLAQRAHRTALGAARYEELRGMLSSWRYIHRWAALLFVLVLGVHIVTAVRYAHFGAAS